MVDESPKSIYDFTIKDIRGNDVSLSQFKGKTLLIVNVASKCGLTEGNYKELNVLYDKYKEQGLEILAFRCNQFLGQEPGNIEGIHSTHCLHSLQSLIPHLCQALDGNVNGKNTAPLYKYLKAQKRGLLVEAIKWNFTKFLIASDGKLFHSYSPRISPLQFEKDIQTLLGHASSS